MSDGSLPSYDPHAIEAARQDSWRARDAFRTPEIGSDRTRKYIKPSAPFTSGNIHIGHVRSYSIGDAYARFCRARGEDVLFAFGFDSFGLPAELGAIAGKEPPSEWVARCAEHMVGQLRRLGFSFDWERAFMSSDAIMYRWSQWLFLTLLDAGLVYRGTGSVDWCDTCQTTLATIQVEDGGTCWRCHNPVRLVQRPQWYLRISAYVEENDRRLAELAASGIWDENALASQRFVLGRVDGIELDLTETSQPVDPTETSQLVDLTETSQLVDSEDGATLTVFTPHADALEQARFVAISPKHPEIELWAGGAELRERLEELRSGGLERGARDADAMPLVDTGRTLPSPTGGDPLPVIVSPMVDGRFGATAVLGIPQLDRTDAVIAERLSGLRLEEPDAEGSPVASPVAPTVPTRWPIDDSIRGPTDDPIRGLADDPIRGLADDPIRGLADDPIRGPTDDPIRGLADDPIRGLADDPIRGPTDGPIERRPAVRYRANDFTISRQRSWGTPIPIVYCESCGAVPIPREQLPVILPLDVTPTGAGNPLAEREDFVQTSCPACGGSATRETDTLDCHFDALWLWVPVCVPPAEREQTLEHILALEDLRAWLPSERVVAGSDSGNFVFDQRTVTKALRDIGPLAFLSDGEPFAGCLFHEMVIRDGRKMSKHLGNVVDPDELVAQYGADTVRLAVLFAARPQRSLNWSDSDVKRCHRFLRQVWDYSQARFAASRASAQASDADLPAAGEPTDAPEMPAEAQPEMSANSHPEMPAEDQPEISAKDHSEMPAEKTEHLRKRLAQWSEVAVEKITEDLRELEMHSAVRNVMRLFDRIRDYEKRVIAKRGELCEEDLHALVQSLQMLARVLAPFAPHIAEQLLIASLASGESEIDTTWPSPQLVSR